MYQRGAIVEKISWRFLWCFCCFSGAFEYITKWKYYAQSLLERLTVCYSSLFYNCYLSACFYPGRENFQKLCKKCAENHSISKKLSAKTWHNNALICAETCWNFVRDALKSAEFSKVQLFSFAPRLEPRSLCLIYQLIHCAIENWNAYHIIWINYEKLLI